MRVINLPAFCLKVFAIYFFLGFGCAFAQVVPKNKSAKDTTAVNTKKPKKQSALFKPRKKVNLYPFSPIRVGNQVWSDRNISVDVEGSKCYDDNLANCQKRGRLYTWEMAKKVAEMYPEWRLPTEQDYEELFAVIKGKNAAKKILGSSGGVRGSSLSDGNNMDLIMKGRGSDNVLLVDLKMLLIQAQIELQKAVKALNLLRYGEQGDQIAGSNEEQIMSMKTSLKLALVNYRLLQLKGATKEELALAKKQVLDIKVLLAQEDYRKAKEVGEKFGVAEAYVKLAQIKYEDIELRLVLAQIKLGLAVEAHHVALSEEDLSGSISGEAKKSEAASSIASDDYAVLVARYSPFTPLLGGCFDDYEYAYYYLGKYGYLWTASLSDEGRPYVVYTNLSTNEMKMVDYFRVSRFHSVRLIKRSKKSLLDK